MNILHYVLLTLAMGIYMSPNSLVAMQNTSPNQQLINARTVAEARSALHAGANINHRNTTGESPLYYFIACHDDREPELLNFLIEQGADINEPGPNHTTPLITAYSIEAINVFITLLELGVDTKIKDFFGKTIMDYAIQQNDSKIIDLLSSYSTKKSQNTQAKSTFDIRTVPQKPLHQAALNGQLDTLLTLILQGADVNKQDYLGFTPLHCAARRGHLEVVQALLAAEANAQILDNLGKSPAEWAFSYGYHAVLMTLKTMPATTLLN